MIRNIEFVLDNLKSSIDLGGDWIEYVPKDVKPSIKKYVYFKKKIHTEEGSSVLFSVRSRYNIKTDTFKLTINANLTEWCFGEDIGQNMLLNQFEETVSKLAERLGLAESLIWKSFVNKASFGVSMKLDKKYENINKCYSWYTQFTHFIDEGSALRYKYKDYNYVYHDSRDFILYNTNEVIDKNIMLTRRKVENIEHDCIRFEKEVYNGGYNFWSIHSCYTLSDIRENWEEIGREIISSLKSVELNDKVNAKDVFKVIDAHEFVKYLRSRKPELLDHSAYLITVLYIKGYTTKQFKQIFKTFTKCNTEEVKLRDEMLMDLEKHAKTVFS